MNMTEDARIASLFKKLEGKKVKCGLCPRGCLLKENQKGFCGTRQNLNGTLYTLVYGKAVRVAQEFMETEGVFHYAPNSPILSIGNMGCNLHCKFCQNWETSQMKFIDKNDYEYYKPEELVNLALSKNIKVLSWTYNDPVVWHEYVMDTGRLARKHGILNLYKSAFYLTLDAVKELCEVIDIFSISLKSYRDDFYQKHASAKATPILENIKYVYQTGIHMELSNLMVTDLNDSEEDARGVVTWHLENTSAEIPLHFVRFHPAYLYKKVARTPVDRLVRARKIAQEMGVQYCYIGNVYDNEGGNTYCPKCNHLLIKRYDINTEVTGLTNAGECKNCHFQTKIKVTPFASVMSKINDDQFKLQSKEVYRWSQEINRVHVEVTNKGDQETDVSIYRLGQKDRSDTRKTKILPKEKYSFIISKSQPDETGIVVCYHPTLNIRISELLDRAHLPTRFKETKRKFVPEKESYFEKLRIPLPWEKGLPDWFVQRISIPIYDGIKGFHILKSIHELDKSQYFTNEEMQERQLIKLKKLLTYVESHSPYYRNMFQSVHFHPKEMNSIRDIQRLSFLKKNDFINNYETIRVKDQHSPFFVARTSGSTGIPMQFLVDHNAMAYSIASRMRGEKWWDIRYGRKEIYFWGTGFKEAKLMKKIGDWFFRNKIHLSTLHLNNTRMYDYYKKIVRFNPNILFCNPSALFVFSQFLLENKFDLSKINLKAIISTTEILNEFHREFFEKTFRCPVINEYGAAEMGVIAIECPEHNLHLNIDNILFEIVDKEGNSVQENDYGEIVVTNLNNYINPFIRYKLGDIGKFKAGTCKCGIQLPMLDLNIGRNCDRIILEDRELPGAVLFGCLGKELKVATDGHLKSFKIYQKDLDKFVYQLVMPEDEYREYLETRVRSVTKKLLDADVRIDFEYVDSIPNDSSGKLRYFVSEVLH